MPNRIQQQLNLIHNLTLMLESASDPVELQEQLLAGLVDELGFRRAIVGIYDSKLEAMTGWVSRGGDAQTVVGHAEAATIDGEGVSADPVAQAFQQRKYLHVAEGTAPTANNVLNEGLSLAGSYYIWPMYLRQQPIGILIVECSEPETLTADELQTLELLTSHASVVLGSLHLCIGRTQNMAVSEERSRIAADLHDSVSQSLFGLAYGLDACKDMLPDEPEQVALVKAQLHQIQPLVYEALSQIRSVMLDILPGDLDRERFINTLHKQLSTLALGRPIRLTTAVTPQFNLWPLEYRQQLMLITHEAIANVARHAEADTLVVELQAFGQKLILTVIDDGIGFSPGNTVFVTGLGIDSIRQRVERLGGMFEITSMPSRGTHLQAQIPLPR